MSDEKQVKYWKANQDDPIFQADLIEVAISQVRDWDGKTFSPKWLVQIDPEPYEGHPNGEWQFMLESDGRFTRYKAKGARMFPKDTLTLVFMDKNDNEIRWELKNLGYISNGQAHVKSIDRALAEAAGREPDYYTQFKRMDRKAAEIGRDLGGACCTVSTPAFKMKGDNLTILKQLIEEKWIAPMSEEELAAAAERGFISRPFRIVNSGVGTHNFQGVTSWIQDEGAPRADQSNDAGTNEAPALLQEDIPF